ncbi:MAG: hypothetical protein A2017_15050 [Lentisphaerae bacterium GWF2_44_16]|nr:MAG: hypothetical protein A2017_15050 [Lentisphaerae bacterium GWF2_44_16]
MFCGSYLRNNVDFYVAVDNSGLWPRLTLLPDGDIIASGYNYPGHATGNGNIDVWLSSDGGKFWKLQGTATKHGNKPDFVRNNHAAGLNAKGEIIILTGGWTKGITVQETIQVSSSSDKGVTWKHYDTDITGHPFGNIILTPQGKLACAIHHDDEKKSYIYWSRDNGVTWGDKQLLAENGTETALLRCDNGVWLAAVRSRTVFGQGGYISCDNNITLIYKSADEGENWTCKGPASLPNQAPADLLEMRNGSILLNHGSRVEGVFGVATRLSNDYGETWSDTEVLISVPHRVDCGYPSSVQLNDGTILTAYYFGPRQSDCSGGVPWHLRYHMGIAKYSLHEK